MFEKIHKNIEHIFRIFVRYFLVNILTNVCSGNIIMIQTKLEQKFESTPKYSLHDQPVESPHSSDGLKKSRIGGERHEKLGMQKIII